MLGVGDLDVRDAMGDGLVVVWLLEERRGPAQRWVDSLCNVQGCMLCRGEILRGINYRVVQTFWAELDRCD